MKKFTFLAALIFCSASYLYATTITVKVSNFQFKPKVVNAKVGDTIKWAWNANQAGNSAHTTTSLTIPAGAVAWNRPIDSAHKTFKYRLRVAGTYQYDCAIHFTVMKGTINVSAALNAGLSDLMISGDDLNAMLNWKTVSSKDIAYFSVQRSTDGDNFREINRVFPSALNTYSFTDKEAKGKYVYYQVKMVDTKGASEYTTIQMQTRNVPMDKLITNLSPNPVTKPGHLMMQFNSDIDGSMRVRAYTQTGKLVKEADMYAAKGVNNGHFHMGDLPSGTYYLVFTLGSRTEKYTVIVK